MSPRVRSVASTNGVGSRDDELTKRRRKEILLGACEVFDQRGYANTRMADIAGHLRIGQGTVYRYFAGKPELMDEIVQHTIRRMLNAMREDAPASAVSLAEFTRQISDVAARLLDVAADEPVLIRVLLREAPAAKPESVQQLSGGLAAVTANYLNQGVQQGFLRTDLDTGVVADAMVGVLIPAMGRVLRGELDRSARHLHAHTIGELITHGVAENDFGAT
ncbi:TetR/AcrR family transcriptional regulator [Mycobacterium sp. NPDC050853]|uniref:TetR/AcrR family transcriptional regulator n=1 Tax=Mycobacterium sp. NPDC050853 TaxID=3155160 RepID=UPI0033C63EB8